MARHLGAHLLAARRMEWASLGEMLTPLVPAAVVARWRDRGPARPRTDRADGHHLVGPVVVCGLLLRVFLSSLAAVASRPPSWRCPYYRSDRGRGLQPRNDPQDSASPTGKVRAGSRCIGDGLGQGVAMELFRPTPTTTLYFRHHRRRAGSVGALDRGCLTNRPHRHASLAGPPTVPAAGG